MGFTLGTSLHSEYSTGTHTTPQHTHTQHTGMQPYPHVGTRPVYILCFSKIYLHPPLITSGFPGGSDGKESACTAGDMGLIPELERSPRGGHGNPLQYSCLENPHGQRSLEGYSPGGCKESDMTEGLNTDNFRCPPQGR